MTPARGSDALATRIFWAVLALTLALRLLCLYEIQRRNPMPIEQDDALGYLIHGAILERDPTYASALLRSLEPLDYTVGSTTQAQWEANRQYHRVKNFYHPLHAALILTLERVTGADWVTVWWTLAYALQIYLFAYAALLLAHWLGPATASLALAMFAFSSLVVPHQTTSAIREWSNAAFLAMAFHAMVLFGSGPLSRKRFAAHVALLFANGMIGVGFHTLGRAYAVLVLAVTAAHALWLRRFQLRTAVVIGALLLVVALDRALPTLLGVETSPGTPLRWLPPESWLGHPLAFARTLAEKIYRASFLPPTPGAWSLRVGVLCIGLGIAAGLLGLARRRTELASWLVAGTLVLALAFSRIGQNYRPVEAYYFFGSYVDSALLALTLGLLAAGWVHALRAVRRDAVRPAGVAAAGVAVFLLTAGLRWGDLRDHIELYARGDAHHPGALIERASRIVASRPSCVVVDGEVLLYQWLLYGSYTTAVAYSDDRAEPGSWRSALDPASCRFAFLPLDREAPGWRRRDAAGSYGFFERSDPALAASSASGSSSLHGE
jgi:hypothetical protein